MKIYISGPITGRDRNTVREAFDRAEAMIIERGHIPVNPVRIAEELPEGSEWKDYMAADIPALFACDAIYQLDGWKSSNGCKLENMAAIFARMPRYCSLFPVPFAHPSLEYLSRRKKENGGR